MEEEGEEHGGKEEKQEEEEEGRVENTPPEHKQSKILSIQGRSHLVRVREIEPEAHSYREPIPDPRHFVEAGFMTHQELRRLFLTDFLIDSSGWPATNSSGRFEMPSLPYRPTPSQNRIPDGQHRLQYRPGDGTVSRQLYASIGIEMG